MERLAAGEPSAGPAAKPGLAVVRLASRMWALLFLLVLVIFFAIAAPAFLTLTTAQNILVAASIPLAAACGQTVVIIGAGIDLSVAYTIGMTAVIAGLVVRSFVESGLIITVALPLALVVALACAAVVGLVNGVGITWLGVPAFIMTLGMYGVTRGIAFLLSGGPAVGNIPSDLSAIGNGYVVYIHSGAVSFFTQPTGISPIGIQRYVPNVAAFVAILVLALHVLMTRTSFGRHMFAIGGNIEAARRAGIPVNRRVIQSYVISAGCGGLAGIISLMRFQAGQPAAGDAILITILAAVVIGGTSLFGGRGSVLGTVIGALIIAVLETGLILLNVSPFWQFIAVGVVVILAVVVDQAHQEVLDRLLRRREMADLGGASL